MGTEKATVTVLVVEDDGLLRCSIVDCLVEAGFGVLEADTAEMALALSEDGYRIDLVFTDISLGGDLNG